MTKFFVIISTNLRRAEFMSEIDIKLNKLKAERNLISQKSFFLELAFILILIDLFISSNLFSLSSLRIQDIGIVIALIFSKPLINMIKEDKFLKRICLLALLYFFYLLLTNLIFIPVYELWYRFIFYILKEVEFFIIFILTIYILREIKSNKLYILIKLFIFINLIYGCYQVGTGNIAYYGIGSLVSPAPSVSGNIYFISFLITFYFFKVERRKYLLLFSILLFVLTLFTVSKTYIILAILFLILLFTIYIILKVINIRFSDSLNFKKIFISTFFVIISLLFFLVLINFNFQSYTSNNLFLEKIGNRMTLIDSSASYRANKTQAYYYTFIDNDLRVLFFGSGKGITEQVYNTYTLGVDNQYIRALIEMGIIGLFLWLIVIFTIIFNIKGNNSSIEKRFFLSLLGCYLAAGLGTEIFQTIQPGTSFWFLSALLCSNYNSFIEKSSKSLKDLK